MVSRPIGAGRFSLGVAVRAALIGALSLAVVGMLVWTRFYATALVAAGLAALIIFDLTRTVTQIDRELERFVDALASDSLDRPARGPAGFPALADATDRALTRLHATRVTRQSQTDYLEAFVDSVTAALFVVRADDTVDYANRAARRLAVEPVARLADIALIGPQNAARLLALGPGGRDIIALADGRQMLGSVADFSTPQEGRRRLICLQDIARELDAVELKAWQDLVRILSHEMMNSLTPISSLAESIQGLLATKAGAPARIPAKNAAEVAAAVEVIARRSLGLMAFVDRYRKVGEIPQPVLGPVTLKAFVARIDRLMSAALGRGGVSYRSGVEPEDLVLLADEDLLEQAVINLLKNAIDAAAGADAPAVSLRCVRQGDWVEIAVQDNGPGFADEAKTMLFVPFFTTKPGGTGIGLSIARQIALAHNGRLEASGNAGSGATFTLVMPDAAPQA